MEKLKNCGPLWSVFAVIGAYIVIAMVITFPFIAHPATTLTAPVNGDVAASVAKYEVTVQQNQNPFTDGTLYGGGYPAGLYSNIGVDRVSFLSVAYLWLGSLTVGPVVTHSLEAISGMVLTAIIAFLFVRRITGSLAAGALAGLIFGFSPHMLSIARAAPTYTHMWMLILPLWAIWECAVRPFTWKWVALAAGSVVISIFWTPYFLLHACIVGGFSLLILLIVWWRRDGFRWRNLAAAATIFGTWVVALLLFWFIGTHSPSTHVPARTIAEIYGQSADIRMYLLPGHFSGWGQDLNKILVEAVPRAIATNLYIGLSSTALLIIGFAYAMRRRIVLTPKDKANNERAKHDTGIKIAGVMAGVCLLACFLFSLPPTVHLFGHSISTPNDIIAHIVPVLRAGQRFIMAMMGLVAVLAGIGLYVLQKHTNHYMLRAALITTIFVVVSIDIWALPPQMATVIPTSKALAILRAEPAGPVAHYQRGSVLGFPGQFPCLLQEQHNKVLVNDCVLGRPDSAPNQAPAQLASLDIMPLCDQMAELKKRGVKYIISSSKSKAERACLPADATLAKDSIYTVSRL